MKITFDGYEFDSINEVAAYVIKNKLPEIAILRYFSGAMIMIHVNFEDGTWEAISEIV